MAEIVLKHVQKVYPNNESKKKGFFGKKKKTEEKKHNLKVTEDGVLAVEDFNLTVHDQEFIVLVGPSGCGKSTTMRMVAGLEDITSGDVLIDGKRVNDVAPKDRDIAMVFQSYALYPNMTVYENMAFTLSSRKSPRTRSTARSAPLPRSWVLPSTSTVSPRRFRAVSVSASPSAAPSCVTLRSS